MRVEIPPDFPHVAHFWLDGWELFATLVASRYSDQIKLYLHEGTWTFLHDVRLNGDCRDCENWHRWLIEEAIAAGWECPALGAAGAERLRSET